MLETAGAGEVGGSELKVAGASGEGGLARGGELSSGSLISFTFASYLLRLLLVSNFFYFPVTEIVTTDVNLQVILPLK